MLEPLNNRIGTTSDKKGIIVDGVLCKSWDPSLGEYLKPLMKTVAMLECTLEPMHKDVLLSILELLLQNPSVEMVQSATKIIEKLRFYCENSTNKELLKEIKIILEQKKNE